MNSIAQGAGGEAAAPFAAAGPFIHVGYHKTASSWLQTRLLNNAELGFSRIHRREVKRLFIRPNPLDFDLAACREECRTVMEEAAARGLLPVISEERLSGSPHTGGYDSKEIAERLAAVFPRGKVLMVLREQRGMILSTYKQFIKQKGSCRLSDYLDPPTKRVPGFSFDHFKFHRLVRVYYDLFGKENVLVLPFELLLREPREFVSTLLRFAGVREAILEESAWSDLLGRQVNVAWPAGVLAVKKYLNPFLLSNQWNHEHMYGVPGPLREMTLLFLRALPSFIPSGVNASLERKWRALIAAKAEDCFRESNRLTAGLTGLDLGRYGYDI